MPRTLSDEARLESKAARARLAVGQDHWRTLEPQRLHLGYRRKAKDQAGQWLLRHYRGGRRYSVVVLGLADDLPDAPGALSYAQAQRLAHSHVWDAPVRRRAGGMTVADAIANHLSYLKNERATAYDAEIRARHWILPKLGSMRVAELTKSDIQDWLNWVALQPAICRGGGAKARSAGRRTRKASANRTFAYLKAALNKAFNDDRVDDDKAWRKVKNFKNVHAARPGFLTRDECVRLLNACDSSSGFRALVRAGLETGCRYGELRRLKVSDFVAGKIYIAESKTGKPRNVALSEQGQRFFMQLAAGRASNEFLLVRGDGLPWMPSNQARRMFAACRAARIDPPVGFHQLRHTYASLSVMGGMPLPVLATNLGHASITMVEKHYGHLATSYVDKTIQDHAPRYGVVEESNVRPLSERR